MGYTTIYLALVFGSFITFINCLEIQDGSCTYRKWEEPGDVKILLIGGVYENEAGKCTSQLSKDGIPLLVAIDWMIRVLNGNNSENQPYIQGLKIGYDIYENCDSDDLTTDLLYSDRQMTNCSGHGSQPQNYAAIISLSSPSATRTMSRLVQPLPVFRPMPSTPSLAGISNLIQTVPSFTFELQTMTEFLSHMKWNYIALINENTIEGTEMAEEFLNIAKHKSICVRFHYVLDIGDGHIKESATNITMDLFTYISTAYDLSLAVVYFGEVKGANFTIEASKTNRRSGATLTWLFPSYIGNDADLQTQLMSRDDNDLMISLINPTDTFNEVQDHYNDLIGGETNTPIADIVRTFGTHVDSGALQMDHINNLLKAILSVTSSVKSVWEEQCTKNGLNVVSCPSFSTVLKSQMSDRVSKSVNISAVFDGQFLPDIYKVKEVHLNLDEGGSVHDPDIDVILFSPSNDSETTLFTYNGQNTPNVNIELPTSSCSKNLECWECRESIDLRYSYLPGDILILGLFSLRGFDESNFRCNRLRRSTNDIITVSAFMQAILTKRQDTGLNIGGIAIDDCYSPFNTSNYLTGLFAKTTVLRDPETGTIIDFNKVFVIIGALSSPVSLVIGDIATSLNIPMISYAASSPELDNRDRYPYFLRTVPSDILQVQGMIKLIKYLNITRVGIIYIDDSYGKSGLKHLQAEAASNHICIHEPIRVYQDMNDDELDDVRRTLYEQQIGVVIYFSIDSIAKRLLQKINEVDASRPIIFVASEAWGTNLDLIDETLGRASKGSLVFNIAALEYATTAFKTFLMNLNVSEASNNRLIQNYFEKVNNCDYIDSYEKYFSSVCGNLDAQKLDQTTIDVLVKDQRGIHIMNAVHTATEGYKLVCQGAEPKSCSHLKPGDLTRAIDDITIDNQRVYTTEGNGNIGMTIYNIRRKTISPIYTFSYDQVGSFTKDGTLIINKPLMFYGEFKQEVSNINDVYGRMEIDTDCNKFTDACSSVCLSPTTSSPTTTTPEPATEASAKDDGLMRGLTIAFGALAGIMALALILLIVLLFRKHEAERHSSDGKYSTEGTSLDAGNTSLYDEPGTIHYGRTRSEKDFQVTGSFLSLQEPTATQYAHIQPSPAPIHHKRHRSNQELISHHGFLQERPPSPMSAPLTQPHLSPAARQIKAANKRSPRISHIPNSGTLSGSPHTMPRNMEHFKKRLDSSPRFRYPSKYSTQQNADLKVSNVDDSPVLRRQTILSDDYERNSVFVDDSGLPPSTHETDSYLYPKKNEQNPISADNQKLTYLTAQDLVKEDSEDEEDNADNNGVLVAESRDPVKSAPSGKNTQNPHQIMQYGYDPSLISPSDKEITAINFPGSETVSFSKAKSLPNQHAQREATFIDSPVDKTNSLKNYGKYSSSTRSNQPDIIPEFGPFDSDDGIIII